MKKSIVVLAAVLAALALICSPALAGSIVIKGSTTVLPIAQKVVEAYMAAHPETKISLSGGGGDFRVGGTAQRSDELVALDPHPVKFAVMKTPGAVGRGFADDEGHAIDFGDALQAGTQVHGVTQHRVGDAELRAHVADTHVAGIESYADFDPRPTARFEPVTDLLEFLEHRNRCFERVLRVLGIGQRGTPKSHDGIAHVLVDGATVLVNDACHGG